VIDVDRQPRRCRGHFRRERGFATTLDPHRCSCRLLPARRSCGWAASESRVRRHEPPTPHKPSPRHPSHQPPMPMHDQAKRAAQTGAGAGHREISTIAARDTGAGLRLWMGRQTAAAGRAGRGRMTEFAGTHQSDTHQKALRINLDRRRPRGRALVLPGGRRRGHHRQFDLRLRHGR